MYPTLRKFEKFVVDVEYQDQEESFIACRMLRDLLHNKHVTFIPAPRDLIDFDATDCLKTCRMLKCQSFTFGKFGDHEHVRTAITSRTPVDDTFLPWLNFLNNFIPMLPIIYHQFFDERHEEGLEWLRKHMLDYDMDAYREQQQLLMEQAVEWNEEWVKSETRRQERKKNRANKHITAALESN
ncbi:hypothetical protein LTR70_005526, partial [Exophiala xenobiotica]